MARLPDAQPRGPDQTRRVTFALARRMYGRTLQPTRVLAHHRTLLVGYAAITLAAERYSRTVPRRLKDLAMLRTALASWRGSQRYDELDRLGLENVHSRSKWALGIEGEGFSEGIYCVAPEAAGSGSLVADIGPR